MFLLQSPNTASLLITTKVDHDHSLSLYPPFHSALLTGVAPSSSPQHDNKYLYLPPVATSCPLPLLCHNNTASVPTATSLHVHHIFVWNSSIQISELVVVQVQRYGLQMRGYVTKTHLSIPNPGLLGQHNEEAYAFQRATQRKSTTKSRKFIAIMLTFGPPSLCTSTSVRYLSSPCNHKASPLHFRLS